jgi:putative sterol carrier protein
MQPMQPEVIEGRADLARAVAGRSDKEINRSVTGRSGELVKRVAEGMRHAFDPARAPGRSAVIQYDIRSPDGPLTFQVSVVGGRCDIAQGAPRRADVALAMSLPDFLRLVAGKLDGTFAVLTRRLSVHGDVLLARQMQQWFR